MAASPCCTGGWTRLRAAGLRVEAGITRRFQVRVSSPLEVAPLGRAASLPLVPTPGVEQEDFHCC